MLPIAEAEKGWRETQEGGTEVLPMLQAQSLHTHVHTHTRTCGNTHKDAEALDGAHLHVETPKAHAHAYMWETAHVCTATYTNMHTRVQNNHTHFVGTHTNKKNAY